MLQLRSILKLADNCGARKLRLIHIVGGSKRKWAYLGDTVTAVVDRADPMGKRLGNSEGGNSAHPKGRKASGRKFYKI